MADEPRRVLERAAAGGDVEAEQKLKRDRCRAGECCGHATSAVRQPDGCERCPFLGWDDRDEVPQCNLDSTFSVPYDSSERKIINAVPSNCPLWAGPVVVDLKQMTGRR